MSLIQTKISVGWEGIDVSFHRHFLFVTHCCFPFFFLLKTYQKHSKIFLLTIAILFCVILWWSLRYPQNIRQITIANIDRISSLYANVVRKMDSVFEAYLGQDAGMLLEPDDIPKTNDPVWILGKQYNATQGKITISTDVQCNVLMLLQNWRQYVEMFNRDFGAHTDEVLFRLAVPN